MSTKLESEQDPLITEEERRIEMQDVQNLVVDSYHHIKSFFSDFKNWLHKSPAIDVGFGIIIGGMFTDLVQSFLKDIIVPPLGMIFGNSLRNVFFVLKPGQIGPPYNTLDEAIADGAVTENLGAFLQTVIYFILVSLLIYWLIQTFQRFKDRLDQKVAQMEAMAKELKHTCPECYSEVDMRAKRCPFCTSFITDDARSNK